MGWLIAIGAIALIAICPLGVCVIYGETGFLAWLLIGPFRISVYSDKKKKRDKAEPKKEKTARKKGASSAETSKKGGSLTDFFPIVQLLLALLGDFRRKIRVRNLELQLVLAGDDPCDLAVNYGKAWAAAGSLISILEQAFVIKKRDIRVDCDFTTTKTKVYARLDITITLGRLLSLGGVYGIRILREFLRISKLRKGGVAK